MSGGGLGTLAHSAIRLSRLECRSGGPTCWSPADGTYLGACRVSLHRLSFHGYRPPLLAPTRPYRSGPGSLVSAVSPSALAAGHHYEGYPRRQPQGAPVSHRQHG